MEYVYVIRWFRLIGDEYESGNFEFCYKDEKAAEQAMLEDVKNTTEEWQKKENERGNGETIHTKAGERNGNGCIDYYGIWFEKDCFNYHDWFIEKLPII